MASPRAQSALPTCEEHQDEELNTFCRSCGKRICETCIKTTHTQHDWSLKAKFARDVRRGKDQRRKDILEFISDTKESSENSELENDIERITAAESRLIAITKFQCDRLRTRLRNRRPRKASSGYLDRLERLAEFYENEAHTADENVIMENEEEYYSIIRALSSSTSEGGPTLRFEEGMISPDAISNMIGSLVEGNAPLKAAMIEAVEIKSFKYESEKPDSIWLIADDRAWFTVLSSKDIVLIKHNGEVVTKISVNHTITNFVMIENEECVTTHFGSKMVRHVTAAGVVNDLVSTAPLFPTGICKGEDGGFFLCLADCNIPDITESSQGEVRHIDLQGMIEPRYKTDENGKNIFVNPKRVAQNINKDLCVVDVIDKEFSCTVIGVTVEGRVTFKYKGQASLDQRFCSEDLCCDKDGRIFVTDALNDRIHILSSEGQFLQYLFSEPDVFDGPLCLSLRNDILWVGCFEGEMKIFQLTYT